MKDDKKNLLTNILYEAKSYNNFEDIERLVEKGMDLSNVPLQPLYVSLLQAPSEQLANVLPKLSSEQRQAILDLDLWNRDTVDVFNFEYWLEVYSKCKDDSIVKEFVENEDFLLYLKSRVNVHTFDAEDPEYPDHDNYFLTDDSLLLFEYADDYQYGNELRYFIRHYYDSLGVENAYTSLFKLINESFSYLQETEYVNKKERLREFGFVDYFDAKESLHPFLSFKSLDKFILEKKKLSANIDSKARNQSLHSSALVPFDKEMENILGELAKVTSESRKQYLHFNFVRLINSTITLNNALRGGRVELSKIGKGTKAALELGLQYARSIRTFEEDESVFDYLDFGEVYKVGSTLWDLNRRRLKKGDRALAMSEEERVEFLGQWWSAFLENSFAQVPQVKSYGVGRHPQAVDDLNSYAFWTSQVKTYQSLAPFIGAFYQAFKKLKEESKLNDQFYLNYEVENIDYEALILSSFINHALGNFQKDGSANKMGLAISELKKFLKTHFTISKGEYQLKSQEDLGLSKALTSFQKSFGLESVDGFDQYLYSVLYEHLSGYEFETLDDEDFAHVGGPVLLNTLTKN